MMKRAMSLMLLIPVLVGCDKEATGQVVAVVNGEEITLSELNAEVAAQATPAGDPRAARSAALERLIERRLLLQTAEERGLQKQPEYLQAERRAREDALMKLFGEQLARNVPVPSAREVDAYIEAHPEQFAERTIFKLDQIVFPASPDRSVMDALQKADDMAQVEAALKQKNVRFERRQANMDSLNMPPDIFRKVLALPPGEPFVLPQGGMVYVNLITGRQPAPLSGPQARTVATELLRRTSAMKAATDLAKQARENADIEYQEGFKPAQRKQP